MTWESKRRAFLRTAVVVAAGGLAGCSNEGSNTTDSGTGTTRVTETPVPTSEPSPTTQSGESPGTSASQGEPTVERTPVQNPKEEIDSWLSNSNAYDGEISDHRESPNVTITVGGGSNGFAFDPAAIRIIEGTMVQWQWNGNGGAHNVQERHGAFSSGTPQEGSGIVYSETIDQPGLYLYKCTNHAGPLGMRGAILVEEQRTLSGYPKIDEWLKNEDFDGILTDRRAREKVTVTVGAEGNGGHFAYQPNAMVVDQGTTVVFKWTGRGGSHDVSWEDAGFDDSDVSGSAAFSYRVTMTDTGVYRYYCDSDKPNGGRGAIVVR